MPVPSSVMLFSSCISVLILGLESGFLPSFKKNANHVLISNATQIANNELYGALKELTSLSIILMSL
jgi:hypothetical protein